MPELTIAQRNSLKDISTRYGVEFRESDYFIYALDATMMAGWAEGWVGGNDHAPNHLGGSAKPTIYVGVSPEGQIHS